MAILDLIEFLDQSGEEIVHRVPPVGSGEFRLGSQCVVRESQVAVFFRDGKALDLLQAGRHTLTTANIPLLANIIGIAFGGNSPFRAEVYFVAMKEFLDRKWGTPEPIVFRDADLGMVRLRAFGSYSMQVSDPQLFVNKIVGTQGIYETRQIENFLRSIIISSLNDLLGENMKSILDLPALYDEIAAGTKAKVHDSFAAVGLELKQMFITAITPPEEVQKMIDQRAAMGAIGMQNMQTYMQFQAAQALRDAAQNPGGAGDGVSTGMGLGAGLGLGATMANVMSQAMQPQQPQQPQQAAPQQPTGPAAPASGVKFCSECGTQLPANAKFCSNCGAKMAVANTCPGCNQELPPGAKFCSNCGTKIG